MQIFWWVAGGYNAVVLVIYGVDKWKAGRNVWRISEQTLLWLAAAGGGPGAWMAMRLFRHKTRKPAFRFGVPAMTAMQAALVAYGIWHDWL